ncbi:hypothetical protein AGLY_007795 [Aphis glycines]|uniref:Uncharacterized protein n=1 Tax=Aphis glycines TaxID=307491 RepID=A0A6G0TNX4_APHGL|nr:hypothetical protein AGLY_007795 [Aphis glycines]
MIINSSSKDSTFSKAAVLVSLSSINAATSNTLSRHIAARSSTRKHIMQTCISSLVSPIFNFAACRDLRLIPGLSNNQSTNPDHDFDHLEIHEPTYLIKLVIGYKTYKTQLNISNINSGRRGLTCSTLCPFCKRVRLFSEQSEILCTTSYKQYFTSLNTYIRLMDICLMFIYKTNINLQTKDILTTNTKPKIIYKRSIIICLTSYHVFNRRFPSAKMQIQCGRLTSTELTEIITENYLLKTIQKGFYKSVYITMISYGYNFLTTTLCQSKRS